MSELSETNNRLGLTRERNEYLAAEVKELRGDRNDLETSYYALLSQCHSLEEKVKDLQKEREYLNIKRVDV